MTKYLKNTSKKWLESSSILVKSKVKEYPDGSKQILVYRDSFIKNEAENNNSSSNGFSKDYLELTLEEIESKRENERDKKLFQVKTKIKDYVLCNGFTHFWNLTQDEKIVGDRHDDEIALSNLSRFLDSTRKQARRKGIKFGYIFVPERHKTGALHFHGFTYGFPHELIDSGHFWKGKSVFNCKQWKYGFSDVTEIIDRPRAASYCTKYITKELADQGLGFNKKKYWSSRGLREPVKSYTSEDLGKGLEAIWTSKDGRVCMFKL